MTLVESERAPEAMPAFALDDPDGNTYEIGKLVGENGILIVFTCNHCPYAQAAWPHLLELAPYAEKQGVQIVAINPNIHPDYPDDSPEKMKELIAEKNVPFPYLVDETQEIAKKFNAQCTPDIYLYNESKELVYHGRIGKNWKDGELESEELKQAIDAVAGNGSVPEEFPSMGCSIKWHDDSQE